MRYLHISLLVIFLSFALMHQQAKAHETGKVLEDETARQIHNMSLEIINVMFKSLPNILDSISAQLRQEADKKYKCSLQSKDYKNEECND